MSAHPIQVTAWLDMREYTLKRIELPSTISPRTNAVLTVDRDAYYILFVPNRLKTLPKKADVFAPWDWKPNRFMRDKA